MLPNAHYMDHQSEIQWSMRAILMDWLVQVHTRFNLLPETLFLTSNYVDRFLSAKVVSLGKLQLVGATALFVAAKYEEINCPSVHEIVYMVDNGYTAEEILKAERFMLSMLHYELGWPGPMSFLRRISKADDYDLETRTLAKYFLEITVMDERFVGSPPSFLAAGAHCLARHMLKKGEWVSLFLLLPVYRFVALFPLSFLPFFFYRNASVGSRTPVCHRPVFQGPPLPSNGQHILAPKRLFFLSSPSLSNVFHSIPCSTFPFFFLLSFLFPIFPFSCETALTLTTESHD